MPVVILCFLFGNASAVQAGTQVTYDFENIGNGNSTFVSSGQTFTVLPELIGIFAVDFGSDLNGNLGFSDGYLDTGFQTSNSGNVGGIDAPTGMTFRAKRFDVWPSVNQGGVVLPAGTLVRVLGFRNGMQIISADVVTFDFGQPSAANVRWYRIDLSGTVFNNTDIDSVQFQLINGQDYIAVDNFIYDDLQTSNQLPTIAGTSANQAVNDDATILPFQNVTLAEPDGENISLTVSLDDNAKGIFTPASLTASGFSGAGPYTLSSRSAAAAQTAIRLLDYNPTDNRVAPGLTEITTFNIASFDGVGTANNNSTTVISTSIDQAPNAVADVASVLEDSNATTIDVLLNDTDSDGGPITVTMVSQPSNGTVTNNNSDVSYQPSSDYCDDGNPTDDFSYTVNSVSSAAVSVTVTCVNDAPTITVLGDIDATGLVDVQNTDIQITGFVDSIVFGPANESNQGVLGFFPNCANDPDDVIDTIIVNAQGELTIDFSLNLGVAICQLTMLDNGGTQNNGNNTSDSVEFTVALTDVIFADGFEVQSTLLPFMTEKMQQQALPLGLLSFDDETYTLYLSGHQLQLNENTSIDSQVNKIELWLEALLIK